MFFNRASALAALTLSVGGGIAMLYPNSWLAQSIAQDANSSNSLKPRWIRQLNLTREQTQQILVIQNKYKEQITESQRALQQAQQELQNMIVGTANQQQIRDKQRQVQRLRQHLGQLRFEIMMSVREILTPGQRRLFAEQMQRMQQTFIKKANNSMSINEK
ncbi:MAG TPA: Spy/CpxP family protein refolding chaperone [Leptolyngbyaceae cyanobacterium]